MASNLGALGTEDEVGTGKSNVKAPENVSTTAPKAVITALYSCPAPDTWLQYTLESLNQFVLSHPVNPILATWQLTKVMKLTPCTVTT